MKRILSLALSLILFVTCIPAVIAEDAETNVFTEGIYTYSVTDGNAKITKVDNTISGDVTIPDTLGGYPVTEIGNWAFGWCESLTGATIPDTVTTIGELAFAYCSDLTSVDFGNSVTTIGDNAFYFCGSLTNVNIPNSVTTIGMGAFYLCDLTSIDIPDSVITIGGSAFSYCKFTSITIPSSVTELSGAFTYCYSLSNITVDENNRVYKSVDGVLFTKDGTTLVKYPVKKEGDSYTIPGGVVTIGGAAFEACSNLTNVTIADSVSTIDSFAFASSGLIEVIIPDSVTTIGFGVFENCSKLTSIVIPNSVTSIGSFAFPMNGNLTLSCYSGSYADTYAVENEIPFVLLDEGDTPPDDPVDPPVDPEDPPVDPEDPPVDPEDPPVDPVDPPVEVPGDASGDGTVNLTDVSNILKHIASWEIEMNTDAADVTGDGMVNLADASLLLKYIAGWDVVLK